MKYTFWFECTDNGGGHQAFEVKAENKQEAIKKGMAFAKKHASGDICGKVETCDHKQLAHLGYIMVAQRGNGKSLRQLEIIDSLMKRRTNYENR